VSKKPEIYATDEQVARWLRDNELRLYCERVKVSSARKQFQEEVKRDITAAAFKRAYEKECRWWKSQRRRSLSGATALSDRGWERFMRDISEALPHMQGVPFAWAVEIARYVCACNPSLLRGLPQRFHVWAEK